MKHENCKTMLSQISDFLDGELSEDLCVKLENHLAQCPDCSIVVDTLQKTIYLYRENSTDPARVPSDIRERLFNSLNLDEYINS